MSPLCWRECERAARNGDLECLKRLHTTKSGLWEECSCDPIENAWEDDWDSQHENGCPWQYFDDRDSISTVLAAYAALNGHTECLRYLHENGCHWNEKTCFYAAKNGHIECLRYAHENACPWDKGTCDQAAQNGHIHCLRYAHEHGCPWDEMTCVHAAKNGHIDCLELMHENGCPWDDRVCCAAANRRQIDCLRYLLKNACPVSTEVADRDITTTAIVANLMETIIERIEHCTA